MASYVLEEADTPVEVFEACRAFCSEMCDDPDCRDTVIYGGNNWYYAYGKSSAREILGDSAYLAEMTEGIENRPFMVMDDGWQIDHSDSYNGGPWRVGNADYGDMGELAAQMRAKKCAPRHLVQTAVRSFCGYSGRVETGAQCRGVRYFCAGGSGTYRTGYQTAWRLGI